MTGDTFQCTVVLAAFALLLSVTVGYAVGVGVAEQDAAQEREAFGEWCDDRGGELLTVQSVYHGGLHCYEHGDSLFETQATHFEEWQNGGEPA